MRAVSGAAAAAAALVIALAVALGRRSDGLAPAEVTEARPNVVLIVIDTLRADHVETVGPHVATPVMKSLASAGTVFETAYAHSATTAPSHATLLTSRWPLAHGVMKNGVFLGRGVRLLAEVLADAGYQTVGVVSAMPLSPLFGFARGFEAYDAEGDGEPSEARLRRGCYVNPLERCGEQTTAGALRWLAEERDPERPFFLFVHLYDPHGPYDAAPPFAEPGRPRRRPVDRQCGGTPDDYRAEVRYTDHLIGELLDGLKEAGLDGSTLLILTADHGETFHTERAFCGHAIDLFEELVRVPLILRWPGRIPAGQRIAEPVGLVDVMPTVLDLTGVDAAGLSMAGQSLAPALLEEAPIDAERAIFFQRRRYAAGVIQKHRVAGDQLGV